MATQRALPGTGQVILEQMRAVSRVTGFAILLAGVPLAATAAFGIALEERPGPVDWTTDTFFPLALLAFVFPLAIWRGPLGSRRYYPTMPVARPLHDLIRVGVGLPWLLTIVGAVLSGAWLVAELTDGRMGIYGSGDAFHVVPLWFWLTPFAAATIAYTLGSALVVGTRFPIIWGILSAYAPAILMEIAENTGTPERRPLGWLDTWAHGPLGFVPAMTGMSKGGGVAGVHPIFSSWLIAVLTWGAVAAIALTFALRRHRDV